jgi:hypothetical protein
MVKTKIKPADILFQQMLMNDTASIAPLSYGMTLWMNSVTEDVSKQILGLAATLICMLQKYDLSHIDVLSIAENIVFSDKNNNMQPAFKQIMNSIINAEEI